MLNVHLLVLSVVIATVYAAVSRLIWGKGSRDLLIYWIAALVGFGVGTTSPVSASSICSARPSSAGSLSLLPSNLNCDTIATGVAHGTWDST